MIDKKIYLFVCCGVFLNRLELVIAIGSNVSHHHLVLTAWIYMMELLAMPLVLHVEKQVDYA